MTTATNSPRAHRGAAYALLVAATVTGFLAILAVWVQRQVLNGDNWTRSSSQLLQDPAIRSAVSAYLVDQLYANVDVEGQLRAALPPRTKGLAGPAAGGLRTVAGRVADQALQRPRVQAAWETANRNAHAQLMRVLNGGGTAVRTDKGVVSLDLGALVSEIDARTGIGGRVAGRLPPGAANIVILRSDQLKFAQNVAKGLRPLAIILVALTLLLFALAIWLARGWRRETLRAAGASFVVAGIAALLVRRVAGTQVVDATATTEAVRSAAESAWRIETSLLVSVASATIAYGIVAILSAWLAGPTTAAVASRRTLAPYLREPAPAYGGLAIIVLLLLVWAPTQALRQPLTALVLVVLVVAGFEVLRRQTAREFPDAERSLGGSLRAALQRHPAANGGPTGLVADTPGSEPPVVATVPVPVAAPVAADPLERLERAAALHERGVLTDDEFRAEKDAILAAR